MGHIDHFYKLGDAHRDSGTLPTKVSVAGSRLEFLLPDCVLAKEEWGCGVTSPWLGFLALPLPGCEDLGELLNLSEPQFP